MPSVNPACTTSEELFKNLVEDVLHATISPQEKLQTANALVRFCTHPEQNILLEGRDLSGVNPPDPEEPPPEIPEEERETARGLAGAFGLRG